MSDRSDYVERRKRERSQDRHSDRRSGRKPFAGADGEGGNIAGRHEYLLLRVGDAVLETGAPLTTIECLNFLTRLPNDKIYVAFFFDYDVTMMLRDMPRERLARLLDMDCRRVPGKPCTSLAVDYGPFQLDYLPRKEFRVRRRLRFDREANRWEWSHWTIINDTGSFFQTSFVKALRAWLPDLDPRIIDQIAEGKEQRAEFGAVTHDERQYNHLECVLLARMMERFRDMCDRVNIRPSKWQGPGNLVSTVMKREGVPRNAEIPVFDTMPDLVRMSNDGYYGGRFELAEYGDVGGPIHQYDINSAYADTYRHLPCLIHGTWRVSRRRPQSGIYVGRVHFVHRRNLNFGLLPVRGKSDGALLFPMEGSGTYWSPEIEAAEKFCRLKWETGYVYEQHCDCSPFNWVYDIYSERKRMEAEKPGSGKVLKLVLASTYGKLAQSVGCAPFSNPMWAALIVSHVRATLIKGALSANNGDDVIMLATDGIFTHDPRPELPVGPALGEWDHKIHPSIFTVQSGIYFIPGESPKTRGTPQSKVLAHEDDFRRAWDEILRTGEDRHVDIDVSMFVGLRLALARNKPELAGVWLDSALPKGHPRNIDPKKIRFDWTTKRYNPTYHDRSMRTDPLPGGPNLVSEPYSRTIGGIRAVERLEWADNPEWHPSLM
jgi:hypothetical protein